MRTLSARALRSHRCSTSSGACRCCDDPARHSLHLPWVAPPAGGWRASTTRAHGRAAPAGHGYVPDFLAPPPTTPLSDFASELERVRATPPETVARELGWRSTTTRCRRRAAAAGRPARGARRARRADGRLPRARDRPRGGRRSAPSLEADIVHRARRLTAGGTIEVFAGLHPDVRWRDGALEVARLADRAGRPRRPGCCSCRRFAWPRVFAMIDEPWQPAAHLHPARDRRPGPPGTTATPARCDDPRPPARDILARAGSPPRNRPRRSARASPPGVSSTSASCAAPASCARTRRAARALRAHAAGEQMLRRWGAA